VTVANLSLSHDGLALRKDAAKAGLRAPVRARRPNRSARAFFLFFGPVADSCAILGAALIGGGLYHHLLYGAPAAPAALLWMGALIAILVVAQGLLRAGDDMATKLDERRDLILAFKEWNIAFFLCLGLVFFSKTGAAFSRGAFLFSYVSGFAMLAGARLLTDALARRISRNSAALAQRIFVVGTDTGVLSFISRHWPLSQNVQIVGLANITPKAIGGDAAALETELRAAVAQARIADPDDVFIVLDRERADVVDSAIENFLTIPASLHLGSEPILERFSDAQVSRIGEISLLSISRRPLSGPEVALKRLFDVVLAGVGVFLLSPLALVVGALIRLDSAGPVFFTQQRYGFNQQPFRIIKFRTMTTMDDGASVQQARVNDPRITRVGAFLRRWNIDELPQILNVLRGDMSLVGPRPHALAHDRHYMQRIALYARRHNVKPGITGWAQVNGFRGETATDDKMRGRVEHDLQYIDNWSFALDVKILFLTLFSSRAYRNAR